MWPKSKDRQTTPAHAHEHGHPHEESGISRRRFLIGALTGVAGFALTRFLPPLPGMSVLLFPPLCRITFLFVQLLGLRRLPMKA